MNIRRTATVLGTVAFGAATLLGTGIASAAPYSHDSEPLTWMNDQHIQVGENGPTVHLLRQVGDECTTISKNANSTTVECTDVAMALIGPMVELHLNNTVTADVAETKAGSINYGLDYQTRDPYTPHGDTGTIAPQAHEHFTSPDSNRPDWFLDLDGKMGNSGTALITLTHNG